MIGSVGGGAFSGVSFHSRADPSAVGAQRRSGRAARAHTLRRNDGVREFFRETEALHAEALSLHQALRRLSRRGGRAVPGEARSTGTLGLTALATAATTLRSSEEINTASTSFSAASTSFDGASTGTAEVGGAYTGGADDTLTFRAVTGGVVGVSAFEVQLVDGADVEIDRVSVAAAYSVGSALAFSNGLTLSLSAGILAAGAELEVAVSASTPGAVDPDQPLDGIGPNDPHLDEGESVNTGTFEVDGNLILVASSDSIQDVLDRVSASGAGVSAAFDAASEAVVLTRDTPGPASISLANDTSGFLSAVKLGPGTETPGYTGGAANQLLERLAPFAGVSAGSFAVNGVSISVDPAADTLADVLDRVSASGAGATASFSAASDRVSITSDDPRRDLTLASDTSGLLAALNLSEGTFDARRGGTSARAATSIAGRTRAFSDALSEAFRPVDQERFAGETLAGARGQLRAALLRPFGEDPDDTDSGFGLRFSFEGIGEDGASQQRVMRFSEDDARDFKQALVAQSEDTLAFLLGERQRGSRLRRETGLFINVARSIEAFQHSLSAVVDGVQPRVRRSA